MSAHSPQSTRRLAAPDISARMGGVPIVCLTAYSAPVATLLDDQCDLLLVGDSVGMVVHGMANTLGVTLDMMILHAQAVMRGSKRAMVVVDMPFGSYEGSPEVAFANATRVMKETGAQGIKVEGGSGIAQTIAYLVERGIPVMGHVGLRPQAVMVDGGFRAKGKCKAEGDLIVSEALAIAAAGAFAIVIEGTAEAVAQRITESVAVPTIGIGASCACDGQILVTDDMIGMFEWVPKFVRTYGDQRGLIARSVAEYADDVRNRRFPGAGEVYFPVSHRGTIETV